MWCCAYRYFNSCCFQHRPKHHSRAIFIESLCSNFPLTHIIYIHIQTLLPVVSDDLIRVNYQSNSQTRSNNNKTKLNTPNLRAIGALFSRLNTHQTKIKCMSISTGKIRSTCSHTLKTSNEEQWIRCDAKRENRQEHITWFRMAQCFSV